MKTSKELREQIAELMARVDAITDLAREEERDLADDEKVEIDSIMGVGKKGEDGYKPGKIDVLEAELDRSVKIEERQRQFARDRAPDTPPAGGDDPSGATATRTRAASIVIPEPARFRYRNLRAYQGPHADEKAFIAGMWALATLGKNESAVRWCREHGISTHYSRNLFQTPQAAMGENAVEKGGYLVPAEMEESIIRLRETYGVFRSRARVVPMASDTKDIPIRSSGLTAYWGTENPASAMTESEATYSNAGLVAKKLYTFTRYSTEISEDAIVNFGDELTEEAAIAIAYAEDLAAFEGTGTSTYGGVTGIESALAAGSEVTAATGNTAFSTLDLTDFEAMIGKLPEYAGIMPEWYISKAGWAASMMRLQDAAGGNTAMMLEGGPRRREFLGYPVNVTQVMNSTLTAQTSTEGICFFGDLRLGALLGDRRGVAMAISDQRYFEYDQLAVRVTTRVDIVIHGTGTASAAGPIIQMLTPAS